MAAIREAHRLGVARALPLGRLVLPHTSGGLPEELSALLGQEVRVAVRIPHWQDLRSLVLQVFGTDGLTLAFAKLALNQEGDASVEAESRGVRYASRLGLVGISTPTILHEGVWQGHKLLVTAPLVARSQSSTRMDIPLVQMLELARADSWRQADLSSSAWWSSACRRVQAVKDPHVRGRLEDCLERLGSNGNVEMRLGTAHGDWTPWNMLLDGDRVLLWDWEHCAADVPFGFDHLHYAAQRRRVSSGTATRDEAAWLRESDSMLGGALGLSQPQRRTVAVAYLLEVNLRFILDRQSTSERCAARTGWGLPMLDQLSRSLLGSER